MWQYVSKKYVVMQVGKKKERKSSPHVAVDAGAVENIYNDTEGEKVQNYLLFKTNNLLYFYFLNFGKRENKAIFSKFFDGLVIFLLTIK